MADPIRFPATSLLLLGSALLAGCAGPRGDSDGADSVAYVQSSTPARFGVVADPLHVVLPIAFRTEGPWLLSDSLSSGSTFTEALPSWNIAADIAFVVDIRVSPDAKGASWSPWLRIGDWGVSTRADEVATRYDGGEVVVDVLVLDVPQMRAELRIGPGDLSAPLDASAPRDASAPLKASALRAEIILSDMTRLDARMAACAAEPWPIPVQLKVPARSQRRVGDDIGGRVCSPTSVAMVAAYHGASVPTREMAETILDPHFEIYGNWNRAVQGAFAHGVPGRLIRVSSWKTVHAYLDAGLPLVASIRAKAGEIDGAPYTSTEGHLLVVTGLAPGGVVRVNDPAASWPGSVPRRYSRSEMEHVWFARGGVAYAFEPRVGNE